MPPLAQEIAVAVALSVATFWLVRHLRKIARARGCSSCSEGAAVQDHAPPSPTTPPSARRSPALQVLKRQ